MAEKVVLEKAITNAIVAWLKANGYTFVLKTHGAAFQAAGLPDIITIGWGGRFVGLEVKRPYVGRLTLLQDKMLRLINRCGGYGVVVCSVADAEDAMLRVQRGEQAKEVDFLV